jgi:rRNA-processing protein FCF1
VCVCVCVTVSVARVSDERRRYQEDFKRCITDCTTGEFHGARAREREREREREETASTTSAHECNAALELKPGYTKALVRRAMSHEKLDQLEDALRGEHIAIRACRSG